MRVFRYWVRYSDELVVGGEKQISSVYGGSNTSLEDAIREAKDRLEKVQAKILHGRVLKNRDYEVDIREEIVQEIDSQNIITRNRYGALVLNSENHMFIDIDQNKRFMGLWDRLLRDNVPRKELLQQKIIKKLSSKKYRATNARVYETNNGFRVVLLKEADSPRNKKMIRIMKDLFVDPTYLFLCIRQNCYRARLTPKPHRINQRRIRVRFPERTEEEERALRSWLDEYESKSSGVATCRLVYAQNKLISDKVIMVHDDISKASSNYVLR